MAAPIGFEESNEHYLALRLQYKEDQPRSWRAFSTVGGSEMLAAVKGAWIRGLILASLVTPIALLLIVFGGGAGTGVAALLWFAAWVVPWFIRDHVYAGHWELSMEGQGHLVEPAFALTAKQLLAKRTAAKVSPRSVRSKVAGHKRYYLTVKQDRYTAYVAILGYGTDLFASWSMWREQMPLPVVWNWLVGIAQGFTGKSSQFHQVVRADPARAMREAVHNATRAGVEAAIEGQHATIVGTFGHEISETKSTEIDGAVLDLTTPSEQPPAPRPTAPPRGVIESKLKMKPFDGPVAGPATDMP